MSESADDEPGSIRLVGTAHISAESADEVRSIITTDRPDLVAVELDEGRYRQLQGEAPEDLEPKDVLKGSMAFQLLAYWVLSYVQSRLGDRFDIEPGADMRAAIDAAEDVGAGIALVDRDIQVTIQRFWARLSLVEKLQLLGGLTLGATGAPIAGLTGGVVLGLFLGPIAGLLSGVVGIGTAPLLGLVGGVAVAAVVAYILDGFDLDIAISLAAGIVLGTVAGPVLGLTDPVVGALFGGLSLRLVAGAVGGVVIGGLLGLTLGLIVGVVRGSGVEPIEEIDLEDLTDTDVVTALVEEFRRFSPGGAEALIDERDAYIAYELVALRERGADVVAVVGAGHKAGIEAYLANPETLPPRDTLIGRETGGLPIGKILGGALSLSILALFGLLVMSDIEPAILFQVVAAWVLYNGIFAFGLAKLAGARWSSASVGGAVAWLTSLNPLLAPGWFAGYMELRHLPVRLSDISTLNELLTDEEQPIVDIIRSMLDVPLFRLVAVVALTNIGSLIASLTFPIIVLPLLGGPFDSVAEITAALSRGLDNTIDLLTILI